MGAFLLVVIGALFVAAGVVGFIAASDALSEIEQNRESFGGLGGLLMDLSDRGYQLC